MTIQREGRAPLTGGEEPSTTAGQAEPEGERSGRARSPRVLVVEDEAEFRELLVGSLAPEGYEVVDVDSGEEALQRMGHDLFDVVLLDLNLPGMHGLNVLSAAPATQTDAQIIVMTGFGGVETAVEAIKRGAFHYLTKPLDIDELLLTLQRALEQTELNREVASLRTRASDDVRSRILGKSQVRERIFQLIEQVAPTRATVLIEGETGTGKELVARAIHDVSGRARRPFVAVNCSALAESLLESELFGHRKGAFTGAVQGRRGHIESAEGGTLFLDEVATIPPSTQVKLLRVLQERTVTPVGGTEPIAVDFRLIAATNEDLEEKVRTGAFREDLYYRLNVVPIRVPPLRERKEDIPVLANAFRIRFAQEHGVEPPPIRPETLSRMMAYDWPGNVRELENMVERSLIIHQAGRALEMDPREVEGGRNPTPDAFWEEAGTEGWTLEKIEREHILRVLRREEGHQGRTAAALGINRRTLYRKLTRYRAEGYLPDRSGLGS